MKLSEVRVTNYRNIDDTGEVIIGQSTCLVGKNEAGKTAFLKALEGLRSTDSKYVKFDKTENYPRRYLSDYAVRHGKEEARVVHSLWTLDPKDIAAVSAELGEGIVGNKAVVIDKHYEVTNSYWTLPFNGEKALQNIVKRFALDADERVVFKQASNTMEAAAILEKTQNLTASQHNLLVAIKKLRDNSAELHAIDILDKRTPKFLYFSHYDRMSGHVSINKLNSDRQAKNVSVEDQLFLDFLEYAGTNLDELLSAKKYEELNAKCEAAANKITDQIFEYWTQNDELRIDVRLTEGRIDDPPPFNTGMVARARVTNNLHRVSVPFSERSAGFIWFFSFLVKFAQVKKQGANLIILLDEPGLTLHGTAQKDLLRYFLKELEPHHQIIYSTHSPFMVPADRLVTVRTVEDVIVKDDRGRKKSLGTKIRNDILTTDPQTNFPLLGAIGFEVTQTLIIGKNTLLVEGPGDILYLQAASTTLKAKKRTYLKQEWAICPSGGIDKILPFVRLFYGNNLNIVVLTDFERGQKRKLEDLYRAAVLDQERILLATKITGKDEADIEDFFEPQIYVDLLNATYGLSGKHKLTVEKLDEADKSTVRLIKKAEVYFRTLPDTIPMLSHFEPALYLLQHPEFLSTNNEASEKTLGRFENAFEKINKFL